MSDERNQARLKSQFASTVLDFFWGAGKLMDKEIKVKSFVQELSGKVIPEYLAELLQRGGLKRPQVQRALSLFTLYDNLPLDLK